jgi:hypothetical protein
MKKLSWIGELAVRICFGGALVAATIVGSLGQAVAQPYYYYPRDYYGYYYGPPPPWRRRSTSGLSGSPAFLNLGTIRTIGGQLKHSGGTAKISLLGLIHGHFLESRGKTKTEDINAGIVIVVSIKSILTVIEEFKKHSSSKEIRIALIIWLAIARSPRLDQLRRPA